MRGEVSRSIPKERNRGRLTVEINQELYKIIAQRERAYEKGKQLAQENKELQELLIKAQEEKAKLEEKIQLMNLYPMESPRTDQINAAFTQARMNMPTVLKDKGGAIKGNKELKFASYDAMRRVIDPYLAKFGLSVIQGKTPCKTLFRTKLMHDKSEQFYAAYEELEAIPQLGDINQRMQAKGSRSSYNVRYEFMEIVGIRPDENDPDAQQTSKKNGN